MTGPAAAPTGRARAYLELARISNLPTVWTNVLAGAVLAGAPLAPPAILPAVVAVSLLYVGGMFLNDVYDAELDRRERPRRPIPSGRIAEGEAFLLGTALLLAGVATLLARALWWPAPGAWWAVAVSALLALVIVYYDRRHQHDPLGPVAMGVCRGLVYLVAALAAGGVAWRWRPVVAGALVLAAYVVGITLAARHEADGRLTARWALLLLFVPFAYTVPVLLRGGTGALVWIGFAAWTAVAARTLLHGGPGVARGVMMLIAGISLLDALFMAGETARTAVYLALAGFAATLALQRLVRGT